MSNPVTRSARRSPTATPAWWDRVVPLALVLLGTLTVVLILFALGVLVGVIQF